MRCPSARSGSPLHIPHRKDALVRSFSFVGAAVVLVAVAIFLLALAQYTTPPQAPLSARENYVLQLTAENSYTLRDGKPFKTYYPWMQGELLEPLRPSSLSVLNAKTGASYEWKIDDTVLSGVEVVHTCKQPGNLQVIVTESTDDGSHGRHYSGTWYCKYVRREIRSLFEVDRESFFSAAKLLYLIPQSAGEAKYGPKYLSMDRLAFMHNNLAGRFDCDHAHNGNGFIITHLALTNVFERSLQAVDPLVTVPYWDYTIEAVKVAQNKGDMSHFFTSEVFRPDWFGEANPPNHVVTEGRFAYTRVRSVSSEDDVHNAYGFVRSPWNANNIPYVTRANTVLGYAFKDSPTCADHQSILKATSWAVFAGFGPHARIHALLGGMWGADWPQLFADFDYDYDKGYEIALQGFNLQKSMWRSGFLVCAADCHINDDIDKCKCTCPTLESIKDDADSINALLGEVEILRDESMKLNTKGEFVGYDILRVMCNDFPGVSAVLGDQLESASPADISFWPIHPTLERLWQWKRLNGGFEDESWPYSSSACEGHNIDDVQPFRNLVDGQTAFLTNREIMELADPNKPTLDYVYDSFEWPHCESMGFPLHLLYD